MKVTAFSGRYYPEELDSVRAGAWECAEKAVEYLNGIKFRMYDAHYWHTFHKGEGCDVLARKGMSLYRYGRSLGLDSLYANSMEPFVKGILKSQVSNRGNYKALKEDEIESIKAKLKDVEDDLGRKQSIKDAIVHYAKTGEWAKPYPKCTVKIDGDGILTGFRLQPCDYRGYECKVEQDIRKLKARCGDLAQALGRREKQLADLEMYPPKRAIFGTRKLYRQKDTVGSTTGWKVEFKEARSRSITISGRNDSPCGNHIVQYDQVKGTLTWRLPRGGKVVFPGFGLMTYMGEFRDALKDRNASRTTVAYAFEFRKDGNGRKYLLMKATFTPVRDGRVNSSFADGCISLDINADRLAWSDISGDSRQLRHGVIPMDLSGLTEGQAADRIGRAVKELATLCVEAKKPLAVENLDPKAMKLGMKYANTKRNRIISQFACKKVIQDICSQAERNSFAVTFVNPKYTSFIGKVLYMRPAGQSVHEAASYVVGLRAMGILPEVPGNLSGLACTSYPRWAEGDTEKEYYYRWRTVYGQMRQIPPHLFFRQLPTFKNKREINKWMKGIVYA